MLEKFLELTSAPVPTGIVHVGAHIGQEILEYKEYAPEFVVWIEADPDIYKLLCDTIFQPWGPKQWCLNALVSDTDDEILDFHVASNGSQSSSMFEFTDLQIKRYPDAKPTGDVLSLKFRTLKTLLDDVGLEPSQVDYLVLDTQGAELKCLGGLHEYIQNLRYITAEVSIAELYAGGAKMHELDAYMEARNFMRVSPTPGYEHGDALYLRFNPLSLSHDRPFSEQDLEHDRNLREALNEAILKISDPVGTANVDFANLEEDLLTAFEKHESIIAHPTEREACLSVVRLAYDHGMARALTRYLEPLGWHQ